MLMQLTLHNYTVFTWLNATVFISLVPKIDAAIIQNRPLLDAQR